MAPGTVPPLEALEELEDNFYYVKAAKEGIYATIERFHIWQNGKQADELDHSKKQMKAILLILQAQLGAVHKLSEDIIEANLDNTGCVEAVEELESYRDLLKDWLSEVCIKIIEFS